MNRNLFLKQLRIHLRGLPPEELEEILQDYDSYFDEAKANGLSEEETVEKLASPREIAKDIIYQTRPPHHEMNSSDAFRNAVVTIGLVLFNLIVVVGPLVGVGGFFFGMIVMCSAFIVSPILSLGSIFFGNGHPFEFFLSLILLGVGMLLFPLLVKMIQAGVDLVNRYIQWNLRMMRGDMK